MKTETPRTLKGGCCVIAAILLGAVSTANSAVVSDSFSAGTGGWISAGNSSPGGDVVARAVGGNPGGFIGILDVNDGWAYFEAPATYRAPVQAGGLLTFDLRSSRDSLHQNVTDVRVALIGGGLTLVGEHLFVRPSSDWHSFSFTFDDAGDFRVMADATTAYDVTANRPSLAQWDAVLSSMNSFYISADYSSANSVRGGFEFTELDNVRYQAVDRVSQVPEPGTLPLMLAGVAALGWSRRGKQPVPGESS